MNLKKIFFYNSLCNVLYVIPWFTKILKVKTCVFLNLYSVHAARILDLSLEIMLSPPKWETKHFYNSKGFSFMLEQV